MYIIIERCVINKSKQTVQNVVINQNIQRLKKQGLSLTITHYYLMAELLIET